MKTRFIPSESVPVTHPKNLGVAYVYVIKSTLKPGCIGVIAYGGNRASADFHFAYKTLELAYARVQEWFKALDLRAAAKIERRQASFRPHSFKINDIVTNSWGYDQTNVDWYRVVKISAHFVWLQPIAGHTEETGFMSGNSSPYVDTASADPAQWGFKATSAPIEQHKAAGEHVSMKYGSGSKWNGQRVYESWYA
jgi:hypothetical protein